MSGVSNSMSRERRAGVKLSRRSMGWWWGVVGGGGCRVGSGGGSRRWLLLGR